MNVIVANDRKDELNSLNIDIIKNVEGIYTVDELIGMFTNFFFNRMIIDITAIKDYNDYTNIKKLFESIDNKKIILYLNENSNNKEYISDLITLGVYNFTINFNEILELYNNPKTYNDVSNLQVNKSVYDINKQIDIDNNINQEKEFTFDDFTLPGEYDGDKKIIGVVNLTEHAGATTLVVQMVKQLNFNYKAIGIEMNKQDFIFFKTPNIYSCSSINDVLRKIREHQDVDAVIVDLNNVDYKEFCTDVIYLIEPGIIKITKLVSRNGNIFKDISGEKIVINRTNMNEDYIKEFEVDYNFKSFSIVSNFRDYIDKVKSVDDLLSKLGYTKCKQNVEKKGFFSRFV